MQFRFDVAANVPTSQPAPPAAQAVDSSSLLQQLIDVQREQLQLMKQSAAAADPNGRWRAFWNRWQEDFPELPYACREALPHLERAFITLIADLANHLRDDDRGPLDSDFALSDFLDRYGIRLSQLGSILSLVGPFAELSNTAGG
jgi:hypothetical protein